MTLLHAIETCLRRTKLPPSRFGREAVRDPRLVHDLRRGRQPGVAVDQRVRMYIARLLEQQPAAPDAADPATGEGPAQGGQG